MEQIWVKKFSGELVPFSRKKLRQSLVNAGAKAEMIDKVIARVVADLVPGKPTHKIYQEAFSTLQRLSRSTAARYHLKKALMQLGPSGFPFEKYVAAIFMNLHYEVEINLNMPGQCVNHEVDVLALRNNTVYVVECKFHNRQGIKSDVKVPMYFHARVQDIQRTHSDLERFKGKEWVPFLATNTRFSEDAKAYSKCEGIVLLSWDYPQGQSLKDWIEISGLYPITALNGLKKREKQTLLDEGIVLIKTLKQTPQLLDRFSLSKYRMKKISEEINELYEI
jgi:hypothetical protein